MDIKKLDRKALKSFFVKNAIPTEGNFKELIDGMINQKDDGIVKLPDEPLSLQADGSATSQKKLINFYGSFADPKPAWTLSLNPYVDPNNPATARPGWNIGDADGKSRLFIDQSTGNVGIGTSSPEATLEVNGNIAAHDIHFGSGARAYSDQGGSIVLGDSLQAGVIPYIDFHYGTGSHQTYNMRIINDASGRLSISGGNLVVDGGSVGIGTSEPRSALDISAMTKRQISTNRWADMSASPSGYGLFAGNAHLSHDTKPHFKYASQHDNIGAIGLAVNYPNWNNLSIISSGTTSSKESEDFTPKVLALFTHDGKVGIGTETPKGKLEVNGVAVISNGNCVAAALGYMASGSLTVGGITTSYGGGQGWTSNTAGLLFETLANTEIAVHDANTRLASLMYYEGDAASRITIGRDMGWGAIGRVVLNGNVGIGTDSPAGKLHVQTGGAGGWDKFVVNTTNRWGDGNNQYVTIGEGGASGIMLYNPHVVWYAQEGRASIRMGRSGGVQSGHWWDIGVRGGNSFSILNGDTGVTGLVIDSAGNAGIGTSDMKAKLNVEGGINMAAGAVLYTPGRMHINGAELLYLLHKNGVIIGREWGGNGTLQVQGMLHAQGGLVQGSDLRLKKDVGPLIQPPEDILKLRGVRFKWHDATDDDSYAMGLVAQEVEEFFPEAVGTGPDGMKGINYSALIAPLIETLKQQQSQIGELRVEIAALRAC